MWWQGDPHLTDLHKAEGLWGTHTSLAIIGYSLAPRQYCSLVGHSMHPPSMAPFTLTQLTRTYLGSTAWGSLTLQKPYITFWISKCPESSSKPPPDTALSVQVHLAPGWVLGKMLGKPSRL